MSCAIIFACTFGAYLLVQPIGHLFWPPEHSRPFLNDLLHQLPGAIVAGFVVAGIAMIERRDRK
jgi:hypothetical protein